MEEPVVVYAQEENCLRLILPYLRIQAAVILSENEEQKSYNCFSAAVIRSIRTSCPVSFTAGWKALAIAGLVSKKVSSTSRIMSRNTKRFHDSLMGQDIWFCFLMQSR